MMLLMTKNKVQEKRETSSRKLHFLLINLTGKYESGFGSFR